jgi:hypothetical protein
MAERRMRMHKTLHKGESGIKRSGLRESALRKSNTSLDKVKSMKTMETKAMPWSLEP